ncbi:MAG: hypothetical protein RR713_06040, partial [Aurantimicrobium sp.]
RVADSAMAEIREEIRFNSGTVTTIERGAQLYRGALSRLCCCEVVAICHAFARLLFEEDLRSKGWWLNW